MSDMSAGKIYIRLLSYLKPFWRRVIILFICTTIFASLSGISLTLIPPFLHILFGETEQQVENAADSSVHGVPLPTSFESMKDSIITKVKEFFDPSEPMEALVRFCAVFLVLMVVKNIFGYVSTYLTIYLEQSILCRIRNELYGTIQVLPMSFFDKQKTGHLISRITNDVTNLRGAVVGSLASIVRNSLMTLIAIFIVFLTSWKLALLTIVLVPVNITVIGIISRKLRKGSLRAQERMADMTSVLQETISGVRVVKAFGMEDFEKGKFDLFNLRYLMEYLKMRRFAELASPSSELLGIVASVFILWYGGRLVIEESLDPANLMLFVGAMLWVVTPIKNLSKLNSVVQEALASGQRVLQILDIGSEDEDSGEIEISGVREKIVYEEVSFSYSDGVEVLNGVELEARPAPARAPSSTSCRGSTVRPGAG